MRILRPSDGNQTLEAVMSDGRNQTAPTHAPTRRQVIVRAAIVFGGLAQSSADARAGAEAEVSHTAESIHQEAVVTASRKRVYEALTDTNQFSRVTALSAAFQSGTPPGTKPTEISREVGGAFSLFGGHIVGRQVDLVPNERIVQAWRVVDWNPGSYSIVTLELKPRGSGTTIDHAGFPKGRGEHLAAGWKANYWEPLQKFLA
jgi:activator of HSP90 ATPase